jgi:hypothetical protein
MMHHKNEIQKVRYLAGYVKGCAKTTKDIDLEEAAKFLENLGDGYSMCGAGFIGCDGGEDCDSDHK